MRGSLLKTAGCSAASGLGSIPKNKGLSDPALSEGACCFAAIDLTGRCQGPEYVGALISCCLLRCLWKAARSDQSFGSKTNTGGDTNVQSDDLIETGETHL